MSKLPHISLFQTFSVVFLPNMIWIGLQLGKLSHKKQDAQLSQTDRAARCVSFGPKWKTGTGRRYFTDIIGLSSTTGTQSTCKAIEFSEKGKIRAITPFNVIHGHLRSSRSVPIESPYATSCQWLIVTDIISRTVSKLSQPIVYILNTAFLSHLLGA